MKLYRDTTYSVLATRGIDTSGDHEQDSANSTRRGGELKVLHVEGCAARGCAGEEVVSSLEDR